MKTTISYPDYRHSIGVSIMELLRARFCIVVMRLRWGLVRKFFVELCMFQLHIAQSCAATNGVNHSIFWIHDIPVRIRGSISAAMCFFSGANTPTSSGWVIWEECSGKIAKIMLLSIQCLMNSPMMWLSCPSQTRRRYSSAAFQSPFQNFQAP